MIGLDLDGPGVLAAFAIKLFFNQVGGGAEEVLRPRRDGRLIALVGDGHRAAARHLQLLGHELVQLVHAVAADGPEALSDDYGRHQFLKEMEAMDLDNAKQRTLAQREVDGTPLRITTGGGEDNAAEDEKEEPQLKRGRL